MNIAKGVIIGPMDKTGALHHKSQFDLTLQINYLSISLLNHGHIAAGALFFKEIGMRYSKDPPPLPTPPGNRLTFKFPTYKSSTCTLLNTPIQDKHLSNGTCYTPPFITGQYSKW